MKYPEEIYFERVKELEAENERLREALEKIAGSQPRERRRGGYEVHDLHNLKLTARAALAGKAEQ